MVKNITVELSSREMYTKILLKCKHVPNRQNLQKRLYFPGLPQVICSAVQSSYYQFSIKLHLNQAIQRL